MFVDWGVVSKLALKLPETEANSHLGLASIRVKGKIFVQQSSDDIGNIVVKLSKERHDELVSNSDAKFGSPPHWGKFGWTTIVLGEVEKSDIESFVLESWLVVAPKSVSQTYLQSQTP